MPRKRKRQPDAAAAAQQGVPGTHGSGSGATGEPSKATMKRVNKAIRKAQLLAQGNDADSSTPEETQQAKQLTQDIKGSHTPQHLLGLLQQHAADLNHIHISAAYTCAVKIFNNGVDESLQQPGAMQQLLQHLHQLAEQQQQCGTRQLASIMWACGHLRYPATVQLLLPEFMQKKQQSSSQDVASTLDSCCHPGYQAVRGCYAGAAAAPFPCLTCHTGRHQ
jgi:hypothetical protein